MRRNTELYVIFNTVALLDFFAGVRRRSYKVVWLVRHGKRVELRTEDGKYTLSPRRVSNPGGVETGKDPEVDVIDLCSKCVRRITGSVKQKAPDAASRVEIVISTLTGEFCIIRMDGYSERTSPWDAIL